MSRPVYDWLNQHHFTPDIRRLGVTTRTAQDAANALGCQLGEIAKSLVFYAVATDEPILIIASGIHRVDKAKVGESLGFKIKTAGPDYVLRKTGFPVGGVPPLAHKTPLRTLIDADLLHYNTIWAAAGTPDSLFSIPPKKLIELSHAEVVHITS